MKRTYYLALAVVLCAVSLTFAMGGGGGSSQKTHRGFEGKITDENGKTLKGVEIVLIRVDASEVEEVKTASTENQKATNTTSGGNGRYKFIAVRPGFYRVRYSMDGYQTLEKLMEFKRGSKDAVLNVQLHKIATASASPTAGQQE